MIAVEWTITVDIKLAPIPTLCCAEIRIRRNGNGYMRRKLCGFA